MHEVEQDPQVQAREMIVEQEHPTAGKVKTIGVPLKFSETKATPAWASPVFGADTQAILREAGYSEEQIEQWMKDKLIVG
jgi:crotonobetainyl-CoA:carnitine CoA-transferase CaiB-like acyl-CoA transferase